MANASKKKIGVGSQGKLDGTGARTVLSEGVLPENMVLSNRDKASHSGERGLDSRQVQTDQFHDHVGARRDFEFDDNLRTSSDGLGPQRNFGSEDEEPIRRRAY